MTQQKPTLTFLLPVRGKQQFLMEQIDAIFILAENYGGLCEILLLTDQTENVQAKLAWLAMKTNAAKHPLVRPRRLWFTSKLDMETLIEAGIHSALGEKIVIVSSCSEVIEAEKKSDVFNRQVLVTQTMLNDNGFSEILYKQRL